MLVIQEKYVVSDEIVHEQFACNLSACKGACCWEGDMGAPLEVAELAILEKNFDKIKPFLSPLGISVLERDGLYQSREGEGLGDGYETTLIENGPCAYLVMEKGIAFCGIEKAWKAGVLEWQKPISCHLYPIRISKYGETNQESLNYDRWDICSAACSRGAKEKMPVYKFVKDALVRKYGTEFYEELDAIAEFMKSEEE